MQTPLIDVVVIMMPVAVVVVVARLYHARTDEKQGSKPHQQHSFIIEIH